MDWLDEKNRPNCLVPKEEPEPLPLACKMSVALEKIFQKRSVWSPAAETTELPSGD